MKNEEQIELLRKVQKVDAPPFLLTRIHARIRAGEAERLPASWKWAGSLAIGLLILMNALAFTAPERSESADLARQYGLYQTQQLYADQN